MSLCCHDSSNPGRLQFSRVWNNQHLNQQTIMKQVMSWILVLGSLFTNAQTANNIQPVSFLQKDSIRSSLDQSTQVFYYSKATAAKPQPLIVQLHSWSFPADSLKTVDLDIEARNKNYNYIFPDFRGVNDHVKACCSDFVIADIDEAIDWAIKNMNIDKNHIYLIGYSGGGYATLAMYVRSRHDIRVFSAWASISDLVAWYGQSIERKNKYAAEIIQCTGAAGVFDTARARERSPLSWATPLEKRKNSVIQIFAGIHDGFDGSVPISQSVNFYNKLLHDFKEPDSANYVKSQELTVMSETQKFPSSNTNRKIGDRIIHYQKGTKNVLLTIFEGGHELLSKQAIEYIEQL